MPAQSGAAPGILLADDHEIVRQGLRIVLEREGFTVLAEASDGSEAVRLAEQLQPDVAILDLMMPNLNGIEAARQVSEVSPRTRTILLTMYSDEHYIFNALRCGIRAYVLKNEAVADLVQAVHEVHRGSTYLSPAICDAVVQGYVGSAPPQELPLAPRERQILQLIAGGKTTKEIAAALGVSVKSAESQRSRMMEKLDVHDTAGLVRYAIRSGLIQA